MESRFSPKRNYYSGNPILSIQNYPVLYFGYEKTFDMYTFLNEISQRNPSTTIFSDPTVSWFKFTALQDNLNLLFKDTTADKLLHHNLKI